MTDSPSSVYEYDQFHNKKRLTHTFKFYEILVVKVPQQGQHDDGYSSSQDGNIT